MPPSNCNRIQELLRDLDALDAGAGQKLDADVVAMARDRIFDELSQLAHAAGLTIYRRGETLDAISMVG